MYTVYTALSWFITSPPVLKLIEKVEFWPFSLL